MSTRQAIDGLGEVFSNGGERRRRDHESEIRDLHAKIGELTGKVVANIVDGRPPGIDMDRLTLGRAW